MPSIRELVVVFATAAIAAACSSSSGSGATTPLVRSPAGDWRSSAEIAKRADEKRPSALATGTRRRALVAGPNAPADRRPSRSTSTHILRSGPKLLGAPQARSAETRL